MLGTSVALLGGTAVWQYLRGRATARAVAESETRYRTLWAHSLDFVVRCDVDGRRLYVNPALAELYGHPAEELLGLGAGETDDSGASDTVDDESMALLRSMVT